MANYRELQDELVDLMEDRSTAFLNIRGRFINRAIRDLQRKRFFKASESSAQFSTVIGQESYSLATVAPRYIAHDIMTITDGLDKTEVVKEKDINQFRQSGTFGDTEESDVNTPNRPASFIITGEDLVFFPSPDAVYTVDWFFREFVPDLVDDTDSNWFTRFADDAVLYKACILSAIYLREDARPWIQLFTDSFKDTYSLDNYERLRKASFNVGQIHDYGINAIGMGRRIRRT